MQKPDFVDEEINNWIKDNKVEIVGLEITSGTDRNGITFILHISQNSIQLLRSFLRKSSYLILLRIHCLR